MIHRNPTPSGGMRTTWALDRPGIPRSNYGTVLALGLLLFTCMPSIRTNAAGTPRIRNPKSFTAPAGSPPKPASATNDADGDLLSDLDEQLYGSNPRIRDSDGDGKTDWEEAHNMTNPNRGPWEDAKLIERFRFNSTDWKTDGGRLPVVSPPASQSVDSFEEKAPTFPPTGSIPIIYNLANIPIDLANGTVRFWYIPGEPFTETDAGWRTLVHARGESAAGLAAEWVLEVQPSSRKIAVRSTVGVGGPTRDNFIGILPIARTPGQEAFEICLSYTTGCTRMLVNEIPITSEVAVLPGHGRGLGMDLTGINALNASPTRRLAIGGKINATNGYERPAQGRIDDIEWFNCAMFAAVPFNRNATPWGVSRNSVDLREAGGWATPTTDRQGIEIHLRRGWEGPVPASPNAEDPYRILRREWGDTETNAWHVLTEGTRKNVIVDTGVTPGKWFEYRLPRRSQNHGQPIWGYAGTTRPALTYGPGFALVVGVDKELLSWESVGGPLHTAVREYVDQLKSEFGATQVRMLHLERMQDDPDLNGRLDPKAGPVPIFDVGTAENRRYQDDLRDNKNAISNEFRLIPHSSATAQLIVLIGHVTVPLSGNDAEDGHKTPAAISAYESKPGSKEYHPIHQTAHLGAWACDAWYGDYDVVWTDELNLSEGRSCFINGAPRTDWQARNVAGDGKFDHNRIPPNAAGVVGIDAGVGRMDFSKMPGAMGPEDGTGNDRARRAELRMTARFLGKTLAFHRQEPRDTRQQPTVHSVQLLCGSPPKPAMPVDRFGTLAVPALAVSVRQYQGALPDSAWMDLFHPGGLSMWGFHGHFGSYNKVSGVWDSPRFSEAILANAIACRTVFAGFMGSYFGDWNHDPENLYPPYDTTDPQPLSLSAGNLLKAVLNQPRGGLAVVYSPTRYMDLSRAAVGFPVGILLRDSVEWHPDYSCRTLYLLGDPTLVAR